MHVPSASTTVNSAISAIASGSEAQTFTIPITGRTGHRKFMDWKLGCILLILPLFRPGCQINVAVGPSGRKPGKKFSHRIQLGLVVRFFGERHGLA